MSAAATSPSTPRGRRLPRSERRAQLLDAARQVFVEQGYHAAAMDDIADHAGVSKPVLYQHFPSKLDLYLALLDAGIDALADALDEALESTHDNKDRVEATTAAYLAFVADTDGVHRLVFESDLLGEVAVRERIERFDDLCTRRVAEVIAADTGLTDDQAQLLASGLIGSAQVAARRWLRDGRRIPQAEAVRLLAGLSWRGISGVPLTHPPTEHDR